MFSEINESYNEFFLARDGVAECTVYVSEAAGEKVQAAAADFVSLLREMSGADCNISATLPKSGNVVLIGPSCYTEALGIETPKGATENECIILKREGNRLALLGNDDGYFTGTQFAVTMLFESLGCGWFAPQKLWQVVPKKATVSVGYLDICHRPAFISRLNNVHRSFPELAHRWYLGGVKRVSGHALTFIAPREDCLEAHPEWFCQINGKRDPYAVEWWQYCYSNEELPGVFAQKIMEYFDEDPLLTQYSIALNDGWYEGWCECECCKAMGENCEIVIEFANRIARIVGKRYPAHKLTFLSYFPTYHAPEHPVHIEPNIEIMFCKECDMFMPVDKGPDNGYHQKYTFEKSNNSYPTVWRKNFEKWLENVDVKSVAIWDWYCIAAAQEVWKDVPWVQGDVATRNLKYWQDHGVQYIYNDQGPLEAFFEDEHSFALRWPLWYVYARGMYDTDLTASDMLMDACKKLYGEAGDVLFAFYSALSDIAAHNTAKTIGWHAPAPFELYGEREITRLDRLIELAERTALSDADARERISEQARLWRYAKERIAYSATLDSTEERCTL